ncbi:TonB-dependent receptor [Pedobacter sp. P351]|uniref:SusC/RagA family TonB-linked outer membrane protein n=1 Tax=Pedobacter superstes TaxID=3133441 RepID=UPI0030B3D12F
MNFYLELSSDLRYIMRITLSQLIIFIVLTGVSYADATNAQGVLNNPVKISSTTTSLNNVLRKIEKVANVKFVYSKSIINADQLVSISAEDDKLSVVLDDLLSKRGIAYEVLNEQIVLSVSKSENGSAGGSLTAIEKKADIVVSGVVTDPANEPLIGVSVKIKGLSAGTTTNVSGQYSITIASSVTNPVLVYSYLGYATKEVAVEGRTSLNVQLLEDVKALEEVVVVGYGTQRRGDVSQAITSVNMENLKEVPVTNVTQALQGRVAGLVSNPNSFRPGSPSTIRLRGSRSLTAGNDPLYVVDGIPINYSIDDINPLDIESIDVLKDAAATAIYGSRGANGVIQVTTKKGKAGKVTIDYSGNTSADNIVRKLEVYNGPEFAQFRRDAFIGTGLGDYYAGSSTAANRRYFPDPAADFNLFTSNDNMLWDNVKNAYEWIDLDITSTPRRFVAKTRPTTAEEKALLASLGYPVLNEVAIYDPSKITTYNWGDDALRTGITQNHNISVSGGSEKFTSSFGGGYYKQNGIIKSQDFTRFTLSNNNNFRPREYLNFGTNLNYSNAIQNNGVDLYGAASGQFPLAHPYDSNGKLLINPGADDQVFNPLNDINTVLDENRINRLLANVFGQVTILKGLSYRAAFGVDLSNSRRGRFNGSLSSVQRLAAPNASYNISNGLVWTLQNQLNYTTTIADKHAFTFTAVQELRKRRDETNNSSANDLTYESQKWYALQNNAKGTFVVEGNYLQDQLASHLGRINYSYNNKYILTAALRHDASSVLSPENNSQLFPSASAAWRLDQESFIQDIGYIDQLKLRAGFGAVGNSGITPYQTAGVLERNPAYYNFGNTVALGYTPQFLRSQVTWERTLTKNLGVDYGLLKGRLSGSIDVYESNTNNIQQRELPGAGGIQYALVNLGNVKNSGLEIALSTINIDKSARKGGFRWTSDFAFSTNKEKITELNDRGADQIAQQWFYGQPIRTYWDFKNEGIFQYTDTLPGGILKDYFWKKPANKANELFRPGKIRVQDISGDTIITDADRVHLGSPNPKWTGSFNNTFSYKGFDLTSFVYISHGALIRDFRPGLVGRYPGPEVNYWTPTNPSNDYQQPNRTSDIPVYWQSLSFRKGSFVRVRTILLAYHVPASFLERFKLSNMTVSVNAVNPFIFSKYKRYDPESVPYNSTWPQGSTNNPAPTSYSFRSFVFGLRMGL